MLEIRAEFRSYQEWSAWLEQKRSFFEQWRNAVLDDVKQFGVTEPISELRHRPWAIAINPANLRESVSAAEINSRKRASLFALDLAHRCLPGERRNRTRILGAEAVTRVSRVLRGAFTHFLGAEYLPTAEERERHYPIAHLDLMDAAFPDAAFDLFFSGDVLEHVPDLPRALREIARMLRPGGIMVSTFPFNAHSETTQRRASLDPAGRVIHHLEPEYHGNPVRPSEGSLVYAVPGWDVLDGARASGFADAKMTLILSSTFGIVSAPVPGIFVMSAVKQQEAPPARLPRQEFYYRGPRLRRVIGLVGLARSGTTLLCSILGVHSGIAAVYEPYNANKTKELPERIGIGRFFTEFPTRMQGKEILLVKETGTQIAFLNRISELLRSVAPPIGSDLIVLLRNPLHAFLSMLEAQKKWWGGAHEVSVPTFQAWAEHNLAVLARLLQMGRDFNALVVSYEALVAHKERLVPALMHRLGCEFEQPQLDFEQYVDKRQVRGDVTIATAPFAISAQRAQERAAELAAVADRISEAPDYRRITEIAQVMANFHDVGIARFANPAAQRVIRPLRELLPR
jgi:SAM-dependent methyltransferase